MSGLALLAGSHLAVWTQAVLVAHQALYLTRRRRRAAKAVDEEQAEDERPAGGTLNAAIFSVVVLLVVLFVARAGALSPFA